MTDTAVKWRAIAWYLTDIAIILYHQIVSTWCADIDGYGGALMSQFLYDSAAFGTVRVDRTTVLHASDQTLADAMVRIDEHWQACEAALVHFSKIGAPLSCYQTVGEMAVQRDRCIGIITAEINRRKNLGAN